MPGARFVKVLLNSQVAPLLILYCKILVPVALIVIVPLFAPQSPELVAVTSIILKSPLPINTTGVG